MKLSQFYKSAIKCGSACDPRKARIASYPDSLILYGDPDTEISKIIVGIDMETPELLLADKIRKEEGLDLVISHHPEGKSLVGLPEVMRLQVDLLVAAGIKAKVARELLEERICEVARRISSSNHMRSVDTARLLDLPFICLHTPADNHVFRFLERLFKEKKPEKVEDIVELLLEIPEYKFAKQELNNGPKIILGNPRRKTGEILFEMTGGTEGSKDAYAKLGKSKIRTIVSMHLGEEHFKKVKDANLNAVIAGHISSDTLGLNLLLDKIQLQAKETFQIIGCSGFRRIKR